jgi:uncharacterized protein YecT (DUF1311 family)
MRRDSFAAVILGFSLLIRFSATVAAEEKSELLGTSRSGAFRVEMAGEASSSGEGESSGDVWVISTKDPAQRAKLPKQSSDSPLDDEIHFSPNEEWIFGLRHVGSGLRYGNVYHLARPLKIDLPIKGEFNDVVWENGVKLGALKHNYSAEGVYAMTLFVAWSFDSSRLLIRLRGGEEKRSMQPGLLYFNTHTKTFEITDYLRKLNRAKSEALACAEPVDPLPSAAELKTRFDVLDRQLNAKYAEVIAKIEKDAIPNVRGGQRDWIKHRDEGARFYVSLFPAAEKERRRLQFLGDVIAARIETPDEEWSY